MVPPLVKFRIHLLASIIVHKHIIAHIVTSTKQVRRSLILKLKATRIVTLLTVTSGVGTDSGRSRKQAFKFAIVAVDISSKYIFTLDFPIFLYIPT